MSGLGGWRRSIDFDQRDYYNVWEHQQSGLYDHRRERTYRSDDPDKLDAGPAGNNISPSQTTPGLTTTATRVVASARDDHDPCVGRLRPRDRDHTIQNILGAWANRKVTLIADNGLTLATGGWTYGICASNLTIPARGSGVPSERPQLLAAPVEVNDCFHNGMLAPSWGSAPQEAYLQFNTNNASKVQ